MEIDGTESLTVIRIAPDSGHGRQLSRAQFTSIGWQILGATGAARDLRSDRKSYLDDILRAVELGDEKGEFTRLADEFQDALTGSSRLTEVRERLSNQLSRALPEAVNQDDLVFTSGASINQDVLSDVTLQILKNGTPAT